MGPIEWYYYLNYEIADPRVNDWILVRTPIPMTIIAISYLYFVLKCGPKYMEKRPAYSCRSFITVYNIFQIVANAAIVCLVWNNGWYRDHFFYCTKHYMRATPQNMQYLSIMWLVLCLKIIDYTETWLFVLRKKKAQISFLHLYHHISTSYIAWLTLKYFCTGMAFSYVVVNNSIHVVMYTYYLLSNMGPKIRMLIHPAKRMITIMQMAQFVFLIIHTMRSFYPGCPSTEVPAAIMIVNFAINFLLFYNFYRKAYAEKPKQK